MYEAFYGLSGKPFQLNPDPQFFFGSRQHRRAMAFIEYGLHQSEGFIVVTGEVGAGKTTLVRNMLSHIDPRKVVAANLVSTQLDAEDTLRMVAAAFGIPTRGAEKAELLLSLEAMLASNAREGKRSLLVVDEAQNLTARAVEELRMLSNFQLGTHALLQTFLVGQPEFRLILQSPHMHQLRQRVIAACHIDPLDAEDTRHYVEHRLARVGWKGSNPQFRPDTFTAIHQAAGGVPRRINLLCDRLLLSGFLAERHVFTADSVNEIAAEIRGETQVTPSVAQQIAVGPTHPELGAQRESAQIGQQLEHVEHTIKDLEAALTRVERGNQATLALFRKFLDWVRTRDRNAGDQTH